MRRVLKPSPLALLAFGLSISTGAQSKVPPAPLRPVGDTPEPARCGLSPDGKWIVYGINRGRHQPANVRGSRRPGVLAVSGHLDVPTGNRQRDACCQHHYRSDGNTFCAQ